MRAVQRSLLIHVGVCLLAAGCSPGTGDQTLVRDSAVPAPDMSVATRQYTTQTVAGVGQSGFQTTLVTSGTTVALATFSNPAGNSDGGTATCKTMNGPAEVRTYEIWYAESTAGGAFKPTKVSSEKYLSLTGVGLALSPAGDAALAYTGNAAGVPEPTLRCGASNLLLVAGKGGAFGAPKAVATSSQSAMLVPDQMTQCIQQVCNMGDATGFWPAVAFDAKGQPAVAFRDIHFGFANDDFASSDVEYSPGPGYSILTVDVSRGGGTYGRLAFTPAGDPAIAHYNGERDLATDGIWVNHAAAGVWTATRASAAKIGEMLGFAISAAGTWGIAYFDDAGIRLSYIESTNGADWSAPVDVDTDGITGQFPSLAFDADGQPAIAYYRCNDYDPVKRSCDRDKDALLLARRSAGAWQIDKVSAQPGVFDGYYPSLGFVAGKAVVAYQVRTFDPGSNTNGFELHVAREQ